VIQKGVKRDMEKLRKKVRKKVRKLKKPFEMGMKLADKEFEIAEAY